MTDTTAQQYLQTYIQETKPLFQNYLQKKIKESKRVGLFPAEVLASFSKIAEKGKKIRGALTVLGYELAGGKDLTSIYEASIFIELFHAAVLVHDDIMDKDVIRRGLPTMQTKFGVPLAICAGDAAFYLSWEKLLTSNFSSDRLLRASQLYTQYAIRLVHGQVLDVKNVSFSKMTENSILNILRFKTAEYTGVFPLLVGATLAGMKNKKKFDLLKEYGISLGWAFQVQDDILGLYGDEVKTGKPVGSDLRENKMTLFIYYVLKNGNNSEKNFVFSLLGKKNISAREIKKAQQLFKEIGAYDYVVQLGWQYVSNGRKVINLITSNKKLQGILNTFIIYIMERTR